MDETMRNKKLILSWNHHHQMWDVKDEHGVFINDFHDCYGTRDVFSLSDSLKDKGDIKRTVVVGGGWNGEEETEA